jgi:hypothetical protein
MTVGSSVSWPMLSYQASVVGSVSLATPTAPK